MTQTTTAKSIAMLEKLVAFDTVSRNSNLALITFVRELLAKHGIESRIVHNAEQTKANLLATIGPAVQGGVVLSGHTDVVPVDGQDWHTNPFTVVARDGLLYGRGTADMKAFIAIILGALDDLVKAKLKVPIHLAFSYDEEVGCIGVDSLIRLLEKELPLPRAVIVGEPTDMKVVSAHKGVIGVRTTVTGHEAHSSQTHRGVSAVMVAAELIHYLQTLSAEIISLGPRDTLFEPDHTTITVNVISGGTAQNIMARQCTFNWDIRTLPEDDPHTYITKFNAHCRDHVIPRMRQIAPECDIETVPRAGTPALKVERESEAERLCRALTGDNGMRGVSFGAEAGKFQQRGISTVICGPGSILQAHQPNEFIEVTQVAAGTKFVYDLVALLSR